MEVFNTLKESTLCIVAILAVIILLVVIIPIKIAFNL